jgi:hypothetical protein
MPKTPPSGHSQKVDVVKYGMEIRISRNAIEASWPEDCAAREPYREVVSRARRDGWLRGSREQLENIRHDLEALGVAWLYDGQAENRREAKMMLRAANTLERKLRASEV